MLLKIDKKERDSFEKTCASFSFQVAFYTDEKNPLMLKVEILDMGRELTLDNAFTIGRITAMEKLHSNTFK